MQFNLFSGGVLAVISLIFTACSNNSGGGNNGIDALNETTSTWTKQLGTTGDDAGYNVTTDTNGNLYVVGDIEGAFDGNVYNGGTDVFIVKYDARGKMQWSREAGTSGLDSGRGIAIDSEGNVYATGYTEGNLDDGVNAGNTDSFLIKYDADGTKLWTRQFGTAGNDDGLGISIDLNNNVYVTGFVEGGIDGNVYAGGTDLFIAKYDINGNNQWIRQLGSRTNEYGRSISTDRNGNIFVTGETYGNLDGNTNSGGITDLFIAKYDTNGTKQWTRQLGTKVKVDSNGITTDTNGNIYITGSAHGSFDKNIKAGAYPGFFIMKFDTDGIMQWAHQLNTDSWDSGNGITIDINGDIYITGYTDGSLDGKVEPYLWDLFVAKYDSNGTEKWVTQLDTRGGVYGFGITADTNGIYVTGYSGGTLDGSSNAGGDDLIIVKYNTNGVRQ